MGFTVLSNACRAALKRAKEGGRNTVNTAEPADLK
jgi:hypothetical protein